MTHTNEIAIKLLSEEYNDYKYNKDNRWHYNTEYKLIVKALDEVKKLDKSDVISSVCEHPIEMQNVFLGLIVCKKCNDVIYNPQTDL